MAVPRPVKRTRLTHKIAGIHTCGSEDVFKLPQTKKVFRLATKDFRLFKR